MASAICSFVKAFESSFWVKYPFTFPLLSTTSQFAFEQTTFGKNSSNDVDKSNLIKVQEDQFLDEFLPKVVCSNANCEVVDKSGNIKGYLTQKELSKALTKEHMADAAKSN